MTAFEMSNGLLVAMRHSNKPRRTVVVTDPVGHGEVALTFSPKGRDVTIEIEDVEIACSFAFLRKLQARTLQAALIEMGWTPPPQPDEDQRTGAELLAEIGRLNEEIMTFQVSDGYEAGHTNGINAGLRHATKVIGGRLDVWRRAAEKPEDHSSVHAAVRMLISELDELRTTLRQIEEGT